MKTIGGTLDSRALSLLSGNRRSHDATTAVLGLLDRARHDIQHGWNAAALDSLRRAVKQLEDTKQDAVVTSTLNQPRDAAHG